MRIRPKAVILDYGNVLSQSQPAAAVERMASMLGLATDRFQEQYWRFRVAYDEAALDPAAYWRAVADGAVPEAQLLDLLAIDAASWAHPAPVTPQWAGHLRRAGFQTALLSNMPAPVRDYIRNCAWLPAFDQRTFSCDLGVSKPARAMYQHAIDGLGVAPGQALFLDDRPENARAAEAMGIQAVVFGSLEEAAAELERRFDLPPLRATLEEGGDEKNK